MSGPVLCSVHRSVLHFEIWISNGGTVSGGKKGYAKFRGLC